MTSACEKLYIFQFASSYLFVNNYNYMSLFNYDCLANKYFKWFIIKIKITTFFHQNTYVKLFLYILLHCQERRTFVPYKRVITLKCYLLERIINYLQNNVFENVCNLKRVNVYKIWQYEIVKRYVKRNDVTCLLFHCFRK